MNKSRPKKVFESNNQDKQDEIILSDNDDDQLYPDDSVDLDISNPNQTLRSYYDQYLIKNKVNLCPEYQREFIWNSSKQNLFIDSIMRKFPIPGFIFIKDSTGSYSYECIDGQHRLSVIYHYIKGEKLNGNYVRWVRKDKKTGKFTNTFYEENDNTKKISARGKLYMTEKERERFNDYILQICVINTKLTFEQICTIFARLQNGEKASQMDKLKNENHPMCQVLRKIYIGDSKKFMEHEAGKIIWEMFGDSCATTLVSKKKTFGSLILRYAQIIEKSIDNISSYLDLNLYKSIEANSDLVSLVTHTPEQIIIKLTEFLKVIQPLLMKGTQLTHHMFYVLADIYNKKRDPDMIDRIIKSSDFPLYNIDSYFRQEGKIAQPKRYVEVRDMLLGLVESPEGVEQDEPIEQIVVKPKPRTVRVKPRV